MDRKYKLDKEKLDWTPFKKRLFVEGSFGRSSNSEKKKEKVQNAG